MCSNTIKRRSTHTALLCFMPDGTLVCYRRGDVVLLDGDKEVRHIPLFPDRKERVLGGCNILYRLLRLGVRTAQPIDDTRIVISVGNMLYELNIISGELSKGYFCGEGIRPLLFTEVDAVSGFEDGIYFGGYVHNFDKKPVSIYHRVGEDEWKIVYTFPQGAINHVHNIIADPYRKCLWILTGDFDDSSAIWKVTDGFQKVEYVVGGNQKYRGCVAFALPEGVLYATDAPFANNNIYLLKDDMSLLEIAELPGSCIYGCLWKDKYVFSTVVEPDGRNETLLRLLFDRKRGAGIKDNFTHMFVGNLKEGFKDIYKEEKDIWPFIFQFGAIKFPTGTNNSDALYFQSVATKKNDLSLMAIR